MRHSYFALRTGFANEWAPASVGSVLVDFDSRFVNTSGSNVTQWNDRSGNGYDAPQVGATAGTLVAADAGYGGRPSVSMLGITDGVVTHYDTSANVLNSIGTNPCTIALVGHVINVTSTNNYFLMAKGGNALGFYGAGSLTWSMYSGGATGVGSFSCTAPSIVIGVFNASPRSYRNSKTPATSGVDFTPNVAGQLRIGNWQAAATNYGIDGRLCRALIWPSALAQPQCEAVLDGLGVLYGISIAP